MKKYKVEFEQVVTQKEIDVVEIEAESEQEAIEQVEDGNFDEIQPVQVDVLDYGDITVRHIMEV